jgi:hypothetical protein
VLLALAESVGAVERVRSSLYRVIQPSWSVVNITGHPAEKSQISEQHRKPKRFAVLIRATSSIENAQ